LEAAVMMRDGFLLVREEKIMESRKETVGDQAGIGVERTHLCDHVLSIVVGSMFHLLASHARTTPLSSITVGMFKK
jgi:hypothetical protein